MLATQDALDALVLGDRRFFVVGLDNHPVIVLEADGQLADVPQDGLACQDGQGRFHGAVARGVIRSREGRGQPVRQRFRRVRVLIGSAVLVAIQRVVQGVLAGVRQDVASDVFRLLLPRHIRVRASVPLKWAFNEHN